MSGEPLLRVRGLEKRFGGHVAFGGVDFEVQPGDVLGVVGESGAGKSTLLRCLSGQLRPTRGTVEYAPREQALQDIYALGEARRRLLLRTEFGHIHQNPRDGLRLDVSAGGNVGERLLQAGTRHYGRVRSAALDWLEQVEIDRARIDELPRNFSGGMQQRLQIARNLVTRPRLMLLDEPTGGLDVSVQARLLDLLRGLVAELGIAAVIVTHDLGVVRLLAHQLIVMRRGRVVEHALTDQVLDDPQHPYTQLLVSSILRV